MHLSLIQPAIHWEEPRLNLDALSAAIRSHAPASGGLVLLPEMFATGFSMNAERTAEARDAKSPTCRWLSERAAELGCCVVGGVATHHEGAFFNEAVVAFPDGDIARYQKRQTFTPGGEPAVFSAGDALLTFDWSGCKIGLSICYDLRFPEIYRSLTAAGAELLINIANWPQKRADHWVALLRARAIENQCYVAGVNRVGEDPNATYAGRSIVTDPQGKIIADAGESAGITSAQLDLESLREWRRAFPALADIREGTPKVL